MALFARQNESDFELLLALGFAGRLKRSGKYVGCVGDDVLGMVELENAATIRFVGRATSSRVVMQIGHSFVDVDAKLKKEPSLLCLHSDVHGRTVRVAVSDLRKTNPTFLVIPKSDAVSVANEPPASARFEIDILAVADDTADEAMSLAQACVRAAIHLGLRFRLRSVHNRLFHAARGSGRKVAVLQDGAKTTIESMGGNECVFEPIRKGGHVLLRDVDKNRYLAVKPGSDGKNVFLVPVNSAENKNSGSHLVLRESNEWGIVYIGVVVGDVESGAKDKDAIEWIMCGMRGRLETRRHQRGWERLFIEFVVQSRERALNNVKPAKVLDTAETNSRAKLRAQVVAGVRNARNTNTSKKGGFNHARALAALSEPEPNASESASSNHQPASSVTGVTATRVAAKASPPTESGSLPRNAQNRKLSKREKRKKRRKAQGVGSVNASKAPSNTAAASSSKKSSQSGNSVDSVNNTEQSSVGESSTGSSDAQSSSSTSSTPAVVGGPSCSACGQAISGPYTSAMGKTFHPRCFLCAKCRIPLTGTGKLHTHNGAPHCTRCYANHCAPRCERCAQPIMDTVVTAMNKQWHRNCLTCTWCRKPLGETFWIYADKPREPHCNECVGAEAMSGAGQRRTVNLPGFGPRNNFGSRSAASSSNLKGGARMHMMPARP